MGSEIKALDCDEGEDDQQARSVASLSFISVQKGTQSSLKGQLGEGVT